MRCPVCGQELRFRNYVVEELLMPIRAAGS